MTKAEYEEIFAKDHLTIDDISKLYGFTYQQASKYMCDLKKRLTLGKGKTLRLTVQGKLHKADYYDALDIPLAVGYGAH